MESSDSMVVILFTLWGIDIIIKAVKMHFMNLNQTILVKMVERIEFSYEEQSAYYDALASFSLGSREKLDKFVENLDQEGRYGKLPELPKGYKHSVVIKVNGLSILIDRAEN